MGPMVGMTFPLAGLPGHGSGDNPYVDYSEIPPRLQWLRGPRTLHAALEAYDKHLRPLPGPNGDSAAGLGPGYAEARSM
jgi:hypothetical protein